MSNIRQINVNGTTFDCEDELARGLVFDTMADAQAAVLAGTVKEGMTIFIKNDDAMEISANAISYGDTTVKHELDELNSSIGNTDISSIGDGSVTGAINELNTDLTRKQDKISTVTTNLLATMTASGQTVSFTLNPNAQYLTLGFSGNNIGSGTIFIPASFVRSLGTGLVSLYLTNNVYPVSSFGFNCNCHLYANKIVLVGMSTGTSAANVYVRLGEHI